MQKAEFWIDRLQLAPHPEGGYYRETYRSASSYTFNAATHFNGSRSYATAIYYLLKSTDRSKLHKIHSDELWFFHAGNPLNIYFFPKKELRQALLLDFQQKTTRCCRNTSLPKAGLAPVSKIQKVKAIHW